MARGRDLEISILSDLDQFDTSDAAQDLEDLGKSAKGMGEDLEKATDKAADSLDSIKTDKPQGELKDLESQADRTAKGLDDEFDTAAKKVDAAFDRIAKSSRSNLRRVDDDARTAGKGMQDFKSEVDQTGRESAASFTGSMEDISDSLQEVSANALAAFGPAGAIVGLAAAAALGTIVSSLQNAADAANETKENASALADEIIEAGGALDKIDFEGRLRDWSLEIADNVKWWEIWQKEATTNIEEVEAATSRAKESTSEFLNIYTSGDLRQGQEYLEQLTRAHEDVNRQLRNSADLSQEEIDNLHYRRLGYEDLIPLAEEHVRSLEAGDFAARQYLEAMEEITPAEVEHAESLLRSSENFGNYRHQIKATTEELDTAAASYAGTTEDVDEFAAMTESAAARHKTSVDGIKEDIEELGAAEVLSLEDLNAAMEEHLSATADFHKNQMAIVEEFGEEGIAAVQNAAEVTGLSIAETSQLLVNGSEEDKAAFIANWSEAKTQAGDQQELADAMAGSRHKVHTEAVNTYDDVAGVLSQDITMPTKVSSVSASDVSWVRRDAQSRLGSINIPVNLVRGTANNVYGHMRSWL